MWPSGQMDHPSVPRTHAGDPGLCPCFKDSKWQGVTTPTFFDGDRVWIVEVEGIDGRVGA